MYALIHSASFAAVTQWTIGHGYWVMFFAMFIEGPIVTAAAAFALSLGFFNFWAIFGISILGDLGPDVLYYAIGYWGRIALVERFGAKIGLTRDRMDRMAKLLHDHAWRTMLALKLTPILPTTGLMVVGTTKMPLKKYVTISLSISLPKTIMFILIGYYFGRAYDTINKYVSGVSYAVLAIIAAVIVIDWLWRKYSAKLGQSIERF